MFLHPAARARLAVEIVLQFDAALGMKSRLADRARCCGAPIKAHVAAAVKWCCAEDMRRAHGIEPALVKARLGCDKLVEGFRHGCMGETGTEPAFSARDQELAGKFHRQGQRYRRRSQR